MSLSNGVNRPQYGICAAGSCSLLLHTHVEFQSASLVPLPIVLPAIARHWDPQTVHLVLRLGV